MRRPRKSISANLDSLLDALANVVGILVMLLVVTQLNVGSAIQDIHIRDEAGKNIPAPKTILEAQEELRRTEKARNRAERAYEDKLRAIKISERSELARKERIMALEKKIASLSAQTMDKKQMEAIRNSLKEQIVNLKKEVRKIRKKTKRLVNQMNPLKKKVLAMIKNKGKRIIRLPDPRPAPEGAKPKLFFCRYGRVVYYEVGSKAFRQRGIFVVTLIWRDREHGETVHEVTLDDSDYSRKLLTFDPVNNYIKFLVWEDSYDVYLAARKKAEIAKFSVGWTPYSNDEDIVINLFGARGSGRGSVD